MKAVLRGFWGLSVCVMTSLASAQQPDPAATAAAADAAPTASGTPAVSGTVSLAPQDREILTEEEQEPRWYGWQNLSLDAGAVALTLTAGAVNSSSSPRSDDLAEAVLWGAAVAYGTGSPIVHLLHHHPWRALGSFGLRGGLPILGGAIGLASATCPRPGDSDYGNCGLGELIVGTAAGVVVALVIDDGFLTWEKPSRDETSQARLGLTPVIGQDGRRELRLFGTF